MPKIIQNVKSDILAAARTMLADTGYETFNMRALASVCGISVGTLYNYFPAKQELVLSIMEEAWERVFAAIDKAMSVPVEPAERLLQIYKMLKEGYNSSHRTWMGSFDSMVKDMSDKEARTCLAGIRGKLALRVYSILRNCEGTPGEGSKAARSQKMRSDALARLITAYCAEENRDENDVRLLIETMIQPL